MLSQIGIGQVGHGDQLQAAVEDAKDVVALKVQAVGIAHHLLVIGGIAKAQVAVTFIELEQVGADACAVALGQFTNRHQRRHIALGR